MSILHYLKMLKHCKSIHGTVHLKWICGWRFCCYFFSAYQSCNEKHVKVYICSLRQKSYTLREKSAGVHYTAGLGQDDQVEAF